MLYKLFFNCFLDYRDYSFEISDYRYNDTTKYSEIEEDKNTAKQKYKYKLQENVFKVTTPNEKYISLINQLHSINNNKQLDVIAKSNNYVKIYQEFINREFEEFDKDEKRQKNLKEIKLKLEQVFDKVKLRNKSNLSSKYVLNLFAEASMQLALPDNLIGLNQFNIAQIIHPNWGYLTKFYVRFKLHII